MALIVLSAIILASPVAIGLFYMWKRDLWNYDENDECSERKKHKREKFEAKYGTVFEGMKKNRLSCLAYILIFVIRRILMTFLVLLPQISIQFFQIFFSLLLSVISLLYLILYKPFNETLTQRLEEFNNVTEVFLLYSVLTFTDANPSYLNIVYDIIFITPLIGNICVHFYFLLKSSFYELKERILKNKCCKRSKRCIKKKAVKA